MPSPPACLSSDSGTCGQVQETLKISQWGGKPVLFLFSGVPEKRRNKESDCLGNSRAPFTTTCYKATVLLALNGTVGDVAMPWGSFPCRAVADSTGQFCFCMYCCQSNRINPLCRLLGVKDRERVCGPHVSLCLGWNFTFPSHWRVVCHLSLLWRWLSVLMVVDLLLDLDHQRSLVFCVISLRLADEHFNTSTCTVLHNT